MASDLITIIIPFYCTPPSLFRKCMNSILSDNCLNMEVLVVDDGSPREYQDLLQSFTGDTRVRLICGQHRGVSAARNTGIREAKGKWIAFVDSDDYVCTETLERIADHISGFSGDVILFGGGRDHFGLVTVNNNSFLQEGYDYGTKLEDKLLIMESALSAGILPEGYYQSFSFGAAYAKLFNRDFMLNNHLLFDEEVKFAEDVLLLLRIYLHAHSIYYYDWYLYSYVNNDMSVTNKFRPGISDDMEVFFQRMREFLDENQLDQVLEKPFYVRAEFEEVRSRKLEFMHPSNRNRNRKRKYREFVRKEPFRTALKKKYIYGKNLRMRISWILRRHNLGNVDTFIRKLHHKGDRKACRKLGY